jgi:hypothetical protein
MKRYLIPILLLMLLVSGCADVNVVETNEALCGRDPSGFWSGLVHGIILPFAFIVSLFKDSVAVYDVCNVGGWYDFGFCLGVCLFTGGSHGARRSGSSETD